MFIIALCLNLKDGNCSWTDYHISIKQADILYCLIPKESLESKQYKNMDFPQWHMTIFKINGFGLGFCGLL